MFYAEKFEIQVENKKVQCFLSDKLPFYSLYYLPAPALFLLN